LEEVDMVATPKQLVPNSWVIGTWAEYLKNIENPAHVKAKGYYYNGKYRIEMTPIGNEHSQDHSIINHAVYLYATLRNIPLTGKDNCSYRQVNFCLLYTSDAADEEL
jgi:hypothetical protein